MQSKTLKQLAEHVNGQLYGSGDTEIKSASTLDAAGQGDITFFFNEKYKPLVKKTKASAVIVPEKMDAACDQLIAADPYYAFMQIVVLLHGHREHKKTGISDKAFIADSAQIGENCHIHPNAHISENVKIGPGTIIYPGVFIGQDTTLGSECLIYPNAVIYDKCTIGNNVIIQANACVGQDGFGFSTHQGEHHKIPQIGSVVLEDCVEIGSCAAIERGTLEDTVIAKGTKVGDCVAIGHGTKVGPHCLLVPQVGIAGSATLGHHCVVGGQAGIVGHIKIGNLVKIAAQAGVINNIPDNATIVGSPAINASKAKRAYALIEHLPQIKQKIKKLEKHLRIEEKKARKEDK